jgi:Tfp pilus assembly protein PilN
MRAVNLLPRQPAGHRKRLPSGQALLAGTAPLVAAAFVYVGFTYEHAKVSDARATVDVAKAELSGLGPAASVASAGQQLAVERKSRFQALQDALGRRVAWDATLDQVARVIPPNVWVTELDAQSPTPTAATAAPPADTSTTSSTTTTATTSTSTTSASPTAPAPSAALFSLSGYAFTNEGVAQTLARLSLVPTLTNVTLVSTAAITIGSKQLVQFQLTATIVGGGS